MLMINNTGFLAAGGPLSALGQPGDLISFVVTCPLENIAPPPEGIQTVWCVILIHLGSFMLQQLVALQSSSDLKAPCEEAWCWAPLSDTSSVYISSSELCRLLPHQARGIGLLLLPSSWQWLCPPPPTNFQLRKAPPSRHTASLTVPERVELPKWPDKNRWWECHWVSIIHLILIC